eukprot:288208-Pelagomonas_calceolata.AAC.1
MHGWVHAMLAAPAIHGLFTPPRQSAADHTPDAPSHPHNMAVLQDMLPIVSANFRAFPHKFPEQITSLI